MADHSSTQSTSNQNCTQPASFLVSPRFKAFTFKGLPEAEPMMSPKCKHSWDKSDSKGIGLALIDDTPNCGKVSIQENENHFSKPSNRTVLFGTNHRVQIPPQPNSILLPVESPKSPGEFGILTSRNSQFSASGSVPSRIQSKDSPRVVTGCISMSEMELSEDYTCVITHGPNPTTTHIFDNCVVENYCSLPDMSKSEPETFLSFCYTCKKNLQQKNDIYIYRFGPFSFL
ncbi:hypothetical protein OIU78_012591 [Salix suchowensis]|nr:hypothetical protein OIU78_012591 [Salix suchowensis]